MNPFHILTLTLCMFMSASCQARGPLKLQHRSTIFEYYSEDRDRRAVLEMAQLMDSTFIHICTDLQIEYTHRIIVEVFPSQDAYNTNVMNAAMAGTPAISGSYRIQMVSPAGEIAVKGIPYKQRLWFLVHEFTHLAVNEISQDIPMWLDEGVACYEGSYAFYSYVCRHGLPLDSVPAAAGLENSYRHLPAADVYSFSFVEYLVHRFGRGTLNQLLRKPHELYALVGTSPTDLQHGWEEFISVHYRNHDNE